MVRVVGVKLRRRVEVGMVAVKQRREQVLAWQC